MGTNYITPEAVKFELRVEGEKTLMSAFQTGDALGGMTLYFDVTKDLGKSYNTYGESYRIGGENGYALEFVREYTTISLQQRFRAFFRLVHYSTIITTIYSSTLTIWAGSSDEQWSCTWNVNEIDIPQDFGEITNIVSVGDFFSVAGMWSLSDSWYFNPLVYDITDCIANWKDIEITLKRDGLSGVFHEMSFPFEFVLYAYDILKSLFEAQQYRAVADVLVYLRRDDWAESLINYHDPQVFNLDFTTYEETDTKIEMETKKATLYEVLKSKGKVVYDIPVTEIKEAKQWRFDRLELENTIVFRCMFDPTNTTPFNWGYKAIGISNEKSEVSIKDRIYANTVGFGNDISTSVYVYENTMIFMYIADNIKKVTFEYEIDITGTITNINNSSLDFELRFTKQEANTVPQFHSRIIESYAVQKNGNEAVINWKAKGKDELNIVWVVAGNGELIQRVEGCCLVLFQSTNFVNITPQPSANVDLNGTITIKYNGRNETVYVDVFKPETLLQRLVNDMTGTTDKYTTEIEDFASETLIMTAAESIRGIEPTFNDTGTQLSVGAQAHTSYANFLKWMNVFGYEEHVDETSVTMRKRAKSFRSDLTAIELGEDECADLKKYVDEKRLYSGVKIGYEKKNIENVNVRFEFNGIHDYATDITNVDNILDLVSPYRADCYGIEFLAQERLKVTTDNKADKDIFLVHVSLVNSSEYIVFLNYMMGNVLTLIDVAMLNDTMFNGSISPYHLLMRNLDLIGVSARNLKFTASDSNSEIWINFQWINEDVTIPDGVGLFDAVMYDIASKNIQRLPEGDDRNGIVRFNYKGNVYEGFIDEISKNPAWESETVWKLRKRKA